MPLRSVADGGGKPAGRRRLQCRLRFKTVVFNLVPGLPAAAADCLDLTRCLEERPPVPAKLQTPPILMSITRLPA